MVLFEDSAALLGIAIAALGTFASTTLHQPTLDGVASVFIGLVLGATAALLARESKSLLIGERADRSLDRDIGRIAEAVSAARVNGVMTVQLAPDQIVAALSLEFADNLRAPEIEDAVVRIERQVRMEHPEVVRLFIKPQTPGTFNGVRRRELEAPAPEQS
jgi:divalent metal cation (Fe/Co/Zn/Cd) transporter